METAYPKDYEDALARIGAVTIAGVTAWAMQRELGKFGKVPAMPKPERAALLALDWLETQGKLSYHQKHLHGALIRKLKYRASMERAGAGAA